MCYNSTPHSVQNITTNSCGSSTPKSFLIMCRDGGASVPWAWLPVEWRVSAEGAWAEGRYALVTAADRAECVAWLAARWE